MYRCMHCIWLGRRHKRSLRATCIVDGLDHYITDKRCGEFEKREICTNESIKKRRKPSWKK